MEPAKSTENLAPKMTSENSRIHLVLIVISVVIAVVALIVACVGLSMKGTTNLILQDSSTSTGAQSGALGKLELLTKFYGRSLSRIFSFL